MKESQKLLAEYAGNGSEAAFRELVERYINLTYSAASRLVDGDAHLAQDVTQIVFADLARMARALPSGVMLGGWLHRHTCFVAMKLKRGERRRQSRERQAVEMNALRDHTGANLAQLAPVLDEAINRLGANDRAAILLRFFEQRDLRSVGEVLGISENTARMRVARALEKLRPLLESRGVSLSAAALGAALAGEAVTAAPAGLALAISSAAAAAAAGGGIITLNLLGALAMSKLKAIAVGTLLLSGIATPLFLQHQTISRLRADNRALRNHATEMTGAAAPPSGPASAATATDLARAERERGELLRLRSEVGRLRAQARQENQRRQTPSAQDNRTADNYVRSDAWTNLGFATPQAALETAHWAVHTGNAAAFKESLVVTDAARQVLNGALNTMMSNAPPEAVAEIKQKGWGVEEAILFPMIAQDQNNGYTGYQILSQTSTSPNEMAYEVQLDMNSAPSLTNHMRFQRFGDNWRQVLDVSDLPPELAGSSPGK